MTNLLAIETAFLNKATVSNSLNLNVIRSTQKSLSNGQKKKFEQTLELAKLVIAAQDWFASEEGKAICNEEGISWNNEAIGLKVFGWQKSFFYKVAKAGRLATVVVDEFKAQCAQIESEGKEPNRTVEGLLKFAKQVETSTTSEGGEGDSEGKETGAAVEVRVPTMVTFTYKTDDINVKVVVDTNSKVTTNNSRDSILEAMRKLSMLLIDLA